MSFKEIIGQEKIIKYFKNTIQQQKIVHAYLFEGPKGIGKNTLAKLFAKAIHCQYNHGDACDECSSCIKVNTHNHPDIKVIEPEGKSIKNHQIEEFQQDLYKKPYESDKKIYFIKEAQTMTTSAQNRLLKTLEEPPEYGVIILMSTNANILLPTIRSRCQIIKLNKVKQKYIEELLKNKYDLNHEETRIMAIFSDGILGKAIYLKESEGFQKRREEIIKIIEKLFAKNYLDSFELFEFFKENKEHIDEILDMMIFWFRDILLLSQTHSDIFLINLDKREILNAHMKNVSHENIIHMIKIIEKTKNDIKANVNFQLAIEMMLLSMQEG
ncbi:DNA polymerase III subunit delta' [Anaerophilus nitritogenes]|uniref:DNA polymerase III subunit delta' n=1 Tax=Anaerophilus nitritogenes TaxID=2498136 RepID=UPI00101BCF98|nr:DNA polymerase III subunit delta' [Anaerophilus nitritogenes]